MTKTYKDLCEIKFIRKTSFFSQLKAGYYLEIKKDLAEKVINYISDIDNNLKSAIEETRAIIAKIKEDAIKNNLKSAYVEFLKISNLEDSNQSTLTEVKFEKEDAIKPRKKQYIAPPKQEKGERVSSITLPKLTLGKPYITSLTHSRIDSAHFAKMFLEPADAYALVKRYKFKKVKYSQGFEIKRKSLFEVKKSAFDLF